MNEYSQGHRKQADPHLSCDTACQEMAETWCGNITRDQENRVSVRAVRQGWGTLQHGISIDGNSLCLNGQKFSHGLGTHADSEIIIQAEEDIAYFGATVGLDQNRQTLPASVARLIFSVEVAGRQLWRSEELGVESASPPFDLELPPGTKEITLKVTTADGNPHLAHADWAGPWVRLSNGDKIRLGCARYPAIPFSFVYDGQPSSELLPNWKKTSRSQPGTRKGITEHVISWKDPNAQLECRMELLEFADYPALEWVVYFRNLGKADTAILEKIQSLDVTWPLRSRVPHENLMALVYRSRGSTFRATDFEYLKDGLLVHEHIEMIAGEGRSSQNWLPFFNTDLGDKGVFTAVGWSGQWSCSMAHVKQGEFHIRAGMEKTYLKLHPGEEIRSPRMAQLFWKDDRIHGHNVFRQFLLHHHTPQINDKPITGPFAIAHWGGMTTQSHLDRIAVYKREKLPQEYLWVDAGWYGVNSCYSPDELVGDWAQHTGDWRVNPKAHPAGLRPIADAAKDAGMKFLLWVEPERAVKGTFWPEQHPDWFLGAGPNLLLNLGNPEALQGCIEFLSNLIRENDVALYREDFNFDPLNFWRENDAPDRQGITEIRFTEGLYRLWDTLLRQHPGLIIDNCASGGRRIDLETISRSIVLWRSDVQCFPDHDPAASQAHGAALSYWLPLHGTGVWSSMSTKSRCDTYRVRSTMGPAWQLSNFVRETQPIQDDYPWDWFRKVCSDYLRVRPLYTGNYYPLTEPLHAEANQWLVYQMDRPDLGEGFVMAFRRKKASWETGIFQLCGLDTDADYVVEDADSKETKIVAGQELAAGLKINLPLSESSALIFYKKA